MGFIPFVKADFILDEDEFSIADRVVKFSDIDAAEITTRYQMMIPNRVLWVSTNAQMYTIGPLSKKLMDAIPFSVETTTIRSFWMNEFFLLMWLLLIGLQLLPN